MPRLGRGNPYVPKTGLGGYLGYTHTRKVQHLQIRATLRQDAVAMPVRAGPPARQGRGTAARRPAIAITSAAASATPAVRSQAALYPAAEESAPKAAGPPAAPT